MRAPQGRGLRRDEAVPRWCRLLLPLIAAAQYALIFVVRPLPAVAHARSRTEPVQGDFTLHTPVLPGVEDEALAPLR